MENLVSYERNQSFVRPFRCFDVVWAYFPYLPFATLLVGLYTRVLPVNNARSFVDLIFRDYDKDGNGSIDFSEFILAMNASLSSSVEEKLRMAFCLLDKDKSGAISVKEMVEVIGTLYSVEGHKEVRDQQGRKARRWNNQSLTDPLTHTLLSHLKWSSFSFLERGFRASRDAVQPTWSRLGRRNNGGGVSERLPSRWWTSRPPQNHVEGNVLADTRENRRCLYFFKILRNGIRQNQRISVREIMLLPRQRPKSPPMLLIRLILRRTFVTLCILFSDFF